MAETREKLIDLIAKAKRSMWCKRDLSCELARNSYIAEYLIAHGVAFAEENNILSRLGEFGKLFMDYKGCPRGAMGRACVPLEEEVLLMPMLTDVDGGKWVPVNADALHELVERYKKFSEPRRWIPVTERLPEVDTGEVLCITPSGQYRVLEWLETFGCWSEPGGIDFTNFKRGYVTHWMPLPEPPKGE